MAVRLPSYRDDIMSPPRYSRSAMPRGLSLGDAIPEHTVRSGPPLYSPPNLRGTFKPDRSTSDRWAPDRSKRDDARGSYSDHRMYYRDISPPPRRRSPIRYDRDRFGRFSAPGYVGVSPRRPESREALWERPHSPPRADRSPYSEIMTSHAEHRVASRPSMRTQDPKLDAAQRRQSDLSWSSKPSPSATTEVNGVKNVPLGPRSELANVPESEVKRAPHVFIPQSSVPVQHSTIRHIGNIIKADHPLDIQVYASGYYILFESSSVGLLDLNACARRLNGERLFNEYAIRAEPFPKGQDHASKHSLSTVPAPLDLGSRRKLGDDVSIGTPSTTSSGTKVPKCHVCKGRAEDRPLVECQTSLCTRRYHQHCLGTAAPENPKEWRCPRCVQKGATVSSKRTFSEFVESEDQGGRNVPSEDRGEATFKKLRLDDRQANRRDLAGSVGDSPHVEDGDTHPEPRHILDKEGGSAPNDQDQNSAATAHAPKTAKVTPQSPEEAEDPEASRLDRLVHQSFTSSSSKPNGNTTNRSTRFRYTKSKLPPVPKDDEDLEIDNARDPAPTVLLSPRVDGTQARDQASDTAQQRELHAAAQPNRDPTNATIVPDSLDFPGDSRDRAVHPGRPKTPAEDPAFAAFTQDLARGIHGLSNDALFCNPRNVEVKSHKLPTRRAFRKKAPTLPDVDLCSQCKIAKVPRRPGGDVPLCLLCKKSDQPLDATKKSAGNRVDDAQALAAQLFDSDEDHAALQPMISSDTNSLDTQTDIAKGKEKLHNSGKLPIISSDEVESGTSPRARPSGTKKVGPTRQRKVITRPSQRRQALSSFDLGDSHSRPSLAYLRLFGMALLASPNHRVQAASVPQWVHDNIPGYDMNQGGWAGSIKAVMKLNADGTYGKCIMTRRDWKDGDGGINGSQWYVLMPEMIGKLDRWDPVNKVLLLPNGESAAIGNGEKQDRAMDGLGISGIGDAIVIADDGDESDENDAGVGATNEDHDMKSGNVDHNSDGAADKYGPLEATAMEPRAAATSGTIASFSREARVENEVGVEHHIQRCPRDPSPKTTGEPSTRRLPRPFHRQNRGTSHEAETLRNKSASVLGSRSPNGESSKPTNPPAINPNSRISRKTAPTTTLPVREVSRPGGRSSSSSLPAISASRVPPLPPPPPLAVEKPKLYKSFFTTWPQYLSVDPEIRTQQIAMRPSRKQLFGKPPLHSRLGATATDSDMLFSIPQIGPPTTTNTTASPTKPHPIITNDIPSLPTSSTTASDPPSSAADAADYNPNNQDSWRSDDATSRQRCANTAEFFGLRHHPEAMTLVPMLSASGELCFKREVDCGRRAKVVYHTGV